MKHRMLNGVISCVVTMSMVMGLVPAEAIASELERLDAALTTQEEAASLPQARAR